MPQSPPAQHPLRGILLFMLALMLFALLDATSKHLTASFAVPLGATTASLPHASARWTRLATRSSSRLQ